MSEKPKESRGTTVKLSQVDRLSVWLLLVLFVLPNLGDSIAPPTDVETATVLTEQGAESIRSGNTFLQLASVVMCFLLLFFATVSNILKTVVRHRLALLYLLFLVTSLVYSIRIDLTIRRLALFGVILVFGFAQAQRRDFSIERFLKTVHAFGLIYTGLVVIGLFRSLLAGHQFFVWRFSLFGQAYTDAEILSFTLLMHWYFQKDQRVETSRSVRTILWLVLPLGIVLTLSRTAIACLIASSAYILSMRTGMRRKKMMTILGVAATFTVLLALTPTLVLEGIFRPETVETLTGRTALWEFLLDFVSENPYWGAGFGAYWSDANIFWVQIYQGWAAPAAHNGFIDVFLNTGLIGLLFLIAIVINAWRSTSFLQGDARTFLRGILIYVLVQNVTQGSFQSPRVFVEVMFWWVYIQVVEAKIRSSRQQKAIPGVTAMPLGFAS